MGNLMTCLGLVFLIAPGGFILANNRQLCIINIIWTQFVNINIAIMPESAVTPSKKVIKAKKPAAKPAHPTYAIMISAAIKDLKVRGGSSRSAILKYIVANYKIADAAKAQISAKLAIRKLLAAEKIIQVKGSFKLPKEEKAAKPKLVKKAEAKKPASKKPVKKVKKTDEKKSRATAKTPAVKKPSTKKPAAKKATKKPVAKKPVPKKTPKKPVAKKAAKK